MSFVNTRVLSTAIQSVDCASRSVQHHITHVQLISLRWIFKLDISRGFHQRVWLSVLLTGHLSSSTLTERRKPLFPGEIQTLLSINTFPNFFHSKSVHVYVLMTILHMDDRRDCVLLGPQPNFSVVVTDIVVSKNIGQSASRSGCVHTHRTFRLY